MSSLTGKLTEIMSKAFEAKGLSGDFGQVKTSDRPDLAHFQCNGALVSAKQHKQNPRETAQSIIDYLNNEYGNDNIFASIEIAGPGFINIKVSDSFISEHIAENLSCERLGVGKLYNGETVVLDYGGPNIAKPMHVGHLRSGIIGDTIRRMLSFAGCKTLGDIHLGDWGTHLGVLFYDYINSQEEKKILDADLDDPKAVEELFLDMSERYPRASKLSKEDPVMREEARKITVKLQNKEEPFVSMWQKVRDISMIGMKKNYGLLNVHFDLWKGESDSKHLIPEMIEDLKNRNFAVESEGALVFPVKRNDDKKEMPPLILLKSDGGALYGTTDLATLKERIEEYNPIMVIYVVDQRQSLHFEQLFRAANDAKLVSENTELFFAGFGTMNGTDGKPFKTRDGGVLRLEELLSMAITKAKERIAAASLASSMSKEDIEVIARKVAIAAIKFADLQNQKQSDYIFDMDRMTSFEGKTGPYLLYQAVRIKSLLQKAEFDYNDNNLNSNINIYVEDVDRSLLLFMSEFSETVETAIRTHSPNMLCDYAYKLAQQFSSFYNSCHILSEPDEKKKLSRLQICRTTLKQLELLLDLLGIDVPDKM